MKKTWTIYFFLIALLMNACVPSVTQSPALATATPVPAQATAFPPTATLESSTTKTYSNSQFGIAFQFPASWFGPEEYIADQTLRVEVGSDKVYPYGTSLDERIHDVQNSYYVVVQYTQNDQNTYWKETYQTLSTLQDGESVSDQRGLTIRLRQINVGRFSGFEFISTLAESAQTEPVYFRQVILYDDQSNLISIMGSPNNVDTSAAANWRDAYQAVDEASVESFHQIIESLTVN